MPSQDKNSIRNDLLEVFEVSLEAQLRAIRRLRGSLDKESAVSQKGKSQVDMAYDILKKAGTSLHINEIINRIEADHKTKVERESLASALTKKVKKGDRFTRTGKNTFEIKKVRQ
jgi:hypothetical protein